jgi:pyruvate dehydrogenase E1 component beta subunit
MTALRYQEALRQAVRDEMLGDPSTIYLGEDVVHSLRGITKGLVEEVGDRVKDTPISEAAFVGYATGAALAGSRPIVEFQIPALLYVAFDQIVNQAQKVRLMTGGQVKVPVTYIFPGSGARLGLAGQHSDHPYMLLAHSGMKTVLPSTAADAYGLLRAAIRDDDPVAFFAPASCLFRKDEVDTGRVIPLGSAAIHRPGTDVTVVAVGGLVHETLAVATDLAESGIDVEVIDPRTIFPLDWDTILASVARTRRLVVVDDSNRTGGLAGEIIATVVERLGALDSRPRRITRADVTVPFAVELEKAVLPSREQIHAIIRETVESP